LKEINQMIINFAIVYVVGGILNIIAHRKYISKKSGFNAGIAIFSCFAGWFVTFPLISLIVILSYIFEGDALEREI